MGTFQRARNSESSYLPTLAPRVRSRNHLGGVTGVAAVPGDRKQARSLSLTASSTFQYTRRACPVIRSEETVWNVRPVGTDIPNGVTCGSGAVRPGPPLGVVTAVTALPSDGKYARSPSLTASSYYQCIRHACPIHPVRRNRLAWYKPSVRNFRMQQLGEPDSVLAWQVSLGVITAVAAVPGDGKHARSPSLTASLTYQ
ncbi:hypothetical protein FIBSPDRAFT_892468 [Athelia psychrophila]|uniref:Uncharacterized protein n=1 Tax=Athelia psychrophila TaxID=1759441 RepID=A0A166IDA3_9AGAM|nr:hypothetical protein FIBSPDRAFT_892468 [Fibularhizoctonia sp. CBS 109695]